KDIGACPMLRFSQLWTTAVVFRPVPSRRVFGRRKKFKQFDCRGNTYRFSRTCYPSSFNRGCFMKRIVAVAVLFLPAVCAAQASKNPVSDVLRAMLAGREKNLVAAFEEMPADKFDYKPTADQMTFGHLAAHVADSNYYFCSNVAAVPAPKTEDLKGTEGKEKLVAAVKASFAFCHEALPKAEDSKMTEDIKWFDGKPRPRAWAFLGLASSWADHYGAVAMYLRLNGVLPPTAKKKD